MASPELQRLWRLAQIDRALLDVRAHAAAMDLGQTISAEIKELEAEDAIVGVEAKKLATELKDLELAQKSIEDKIKRIDKQLYGGSLVSAREAENYKKEIEALKRTRDSEDTRILELWELIPPSKAAADKIQAKLEEKKKQLAERRQKAATEKIELEKEFKRLSADRPEALAAVKNPSLVARYDAIRQKHGGLGMSEVTKKGSCSICGTLLPERTLQGLREDRLVTCESCHRILYFTDGLI